MMCGGDHVPEAVVEDILLRLPETTLVRLSIVCKTWHSLINNRTFISSHLSNPTTPPSLLYSHFMTHTATFLPRVLHMAEPPPHPYPFQIVDSLHGVLCLIQGDIHTITLWNPSIRRHHVVQAPIAEHILGLGFGFDSKNLDFKIIRILNNHSGDVYSLNQGAWKSIGFSIEVEQFSDTRCFLNGNVHWLVTTNDKNKILMFDVVEETFNMMQLPPELVDAPLLGVRVTTIKGFLSVLDYFDLYDWCYCEVWMMREPDSWTRNYSLKIQGGRDLFHLNGRGEVALLRWVQLGFDTESKYTTDLELHCKAFFGFEYIGSLVLLDRQNDVITCPIKTPLINTPAKRRKRCRSV